MNKNKLLKKWIIITLCCALVAFSIPMLTISFLAKESKPVVIVLDPGHGGSDSGAVNYADGLYESNLNLEIALACRDELLKYDNVEVYMTHTGLDYNAGVLSLRERTNYVNEVGGDILISLHCNDSDNKSANGAEVYVSHSKHKETYNQQSTQLGIALMKQFGSLGLRVRGVKTRYSNGSRMYYYEDGSKEVGDYYAVIGETIKRFGVPGILVEHGFVSGDARFLGKSENLVALGVADATAIAEHYGLKLKGSEPEPEPEEEEPVDEQEAVIVTDADIISASDVVNRLISLPAEPTTDYYEAMQDIRISYERLSYAAKTRVESEPVEKLYRDLVVLDARLRPMRLSVREDSELTVDRVRRIVTGVDVTQGTVKGTNVAELNEAISIYVDEKYASDEQRNLTGTAVIIVDREDNRMDIADIVGTGTKVQLWKNGELLDELSVVIMGDVNGDSAVDSMDQYVLEEHIYHGQPLDNAAMLAADVSQDGDVDERDIEAIVHEILYPNN